MMASTDERSISHLTENTNKKELEHYLDVNFKETINNSNVDKRLLILELVVNKLREKDIGTIVYKADSYIKAFELIRYGAKKRLVPEEENRKRIVDTLSNSMFPELVVKLWRATERSYEKIRKKSEDPEIWVVLGTKTETRENWLGPAKILQLCLDFYWKVTDIQDEQFVKSIYKRLGDFLLELLSSQFITSAYVKKHYYPYVLAKAAVAIIHNFCHSVPTCHTQLKKKGAVLILKQFIDHKSVVQRFFIASTIFAVSYLLTDDVEKSNFELRGENLAFLIVLLKRAIPTGSADKFDISELITGLDRIAAIDANKMLLVEIGILDCCAELLAKGQAGVPKSHDTDANKKRKPSVDKIPVSDASKAIKTAIPKNHDSGVLKRQQADVLKNRDRSVEKKRKAVVPNNLVSSPVQPSDSVKPKDHEPDSAKSHKDLLSNPETGVKKKSEKDSALELLEQKILVMNLLFTLSLFIETKWELFCHKQCFQIIEEINEGTAKGEKRVKPSVAKKPKTKEEIKEKELKEAAKKVLWQLRPSILDKKSENTTGLKHIMLSYQHSVQEEVLILERKLTERGFNVWIDMKHMSENTTDAMVSAIENAAVFMPILTEQYKTSTNCRSEFSYAQHKKRKIIPVIVNEYRPDSWIKFSLGDTYWYNVKKSVDYHKLMDELKQLLAAEQVGNFKLDANSNESTYYNWSQDDFSNWITKNKCEYFKKGLQGLDGPLLRELAKLKNENQQEYYRLLAGDQKMLKDVLQLNKALSELHLNQDQGESSEDLKEE